MPVSPVRHGPTKERTVSPTTATEWGLIAGGILVAIIAVVKALTCGGTNELGKIFGVEPTVCQQDVNSR